MPPKKTRRTEDDSGVAVNAPATSSDAAAASSTSNTNTASIGADEKYKTGPFSLLYNAVHTPGTNVLILCRNQKRVFAKVRAFDRHYNMLLEGAQEISSEKDESGQNKIRMLDKLFLRGDSVISVVAVKP